MPKTFGLEYNNNWGYIYVVEYTDPDKTMWKKLYTTDGTMDAADKLDEVRAKDFADENLQVTN